MKGLGKIIGGAVASIMARHSNSDLASIVARAQRSGDRSPRVRLALAELKRRERLRRAAGE